MPLLLADFTHARDCKLNLRKNVDTTNHLSNRNVLNGYRQVLTLLDVDQPDHQLYLRTRYYRKAIMVKLYFL